MNEREDELFEAELRRLSPARLPDELQARLESPPVVRPCREERRPGAEGGGWWPWLRWLAPAALAGCVILLLAARGNRGRTTAPAPPETAGKVLRADQVEIDRQLLSAFDAVATLPDGEPVRFRCREWMDAVTLRDSARGVEVVRRTPRIEVVPVSFATY